MSREYPASHPMHDARLPEGKPPRWTNLPRWERLSAKESRALLLLLHLGHNAAIAKVMKTTESVVKNLFSRIFNKVGVDSRVQLAAAWLEDHPVPRYGARAEDEFWRILQHTLDIVNKGGAKFD